MPFSQTPAAYSQPALQAILEKFMPFIPFGKNSNGILSIRSTGRFRPVYPVYAIVSHIPSPF
jgi:hypothetical protein